MREWMFKEGMFESEDGQLIHLLGIDTYVKVDELYREVTKGLMVALTDDATAIDILHFLSKVMRDDLLKPPNIKSEESKKRYKLVYEVTGKLKEKIQRLPGNLDLIGQFNIFTAGLQTLWGAMTDVPQAKPFGPEEYTNSLEEPLQRMLMLFGAIPMPNDEPLQAKITASLRQLYYAINFRPIDLVGTRGPYTKASDDMARLQEQRMAKGFDPESKEGVKKIWEVMDRLWNHMTGGPVAHGEKPIEVIREALEIVARIFEGIRAVDEEKEREEKEKEEAEDRKEEAKYKDQALEKIQQQLQRLLEQMRRQDQGEGQNNWNGDRSNGKEGNSQLPRGNGQEDPMAEIRKLLGEIERSRGNREDEKPEQNSRFNGEGKQESNNNNQAREIEDLVRQIRHLLDNYQNGNGGIGNGQPETRERIKTYRDRLADDTARSADVTDKLNKLRATIRELMADHVSGRSLADNKGKREEAQKALETINDMIDRDNIQLPATAITELLNVENDLANLERLAKGEPCEREFWKRWMPKDEEDKWEPASYAFFGPEPNTPSKPVGPPAPREGNAEQAKRK